MTGAARGYDFHSHLDLFPDPAAAMADCETHRVVTLAVTTTPRAWAQNKRWTAGNRYVFAALGLHPELAGDRPHEVELLERLMPESAFIGEIGLDGSPPHRSTLPVQRQIFIRVLEAAQRLGGRVASIHSRRAARDVLECLETHTTTARVLPILHWFSDSVSTAKKAAEQGCYFSVNHRMLVSESGTAVVRSLPGDRLLTETDAPFTETNGRKSEPKDVLTTASALASLRGVSTAEMSEVLRSNAARVLAFAGFRDTFAP
jgi:TatD DNase family protein